MSIIIEMKSRSRPGHCAAARHRIRVLGRREPRDFAARRRFEAKERVDGFARRARIHELTFRLPWRG
jgi:hypothetical protein